MNPPYGQTRTRVAARHALIAPDGHVNSIIPGIEAASATILISAGMGAKLSQLLVTFTRGGGIDLPANAVEAAGYVMRGGGALSIGSRKAKLAAGGFFFVPAGQSWTFTAPRPNTQLTLFQKKFAPLAGTASPEAIIGDAAKIPGKPFLGNEDALLQVLLPDHPAFDLAMNIFTYQPGATLPFVETHIMEHGLMMLAGQGIYRLEDSWYPVAAGDAIWMAPYCPQWFVAMGKAPASYLYYKDVNRAAL